MIGAVLPRLRSSIAVVVGQGNVIFAIKAGCLYGGLTEGGLACIGHPGKDKTWGLLRQGFENEATCLTSELWCALPLNDVESIVPLNIMLI